MTTRQARGSLPLLAVPHGYRSVPLLALAAAASGTCELLWIVDGDDPEVMAMGPMLRRLGTVVDVTGLSRSEIVQAVAAHRPDGITVFRDEDIMTASHVATELGLPFHSPETAERLVDKVRQRQALHDGGLPVPRWWEVPPLSDRSAVAALARVVSYPAVLKPTHGSGAWYTLPVSDADQLVELLDRLPDEASGQPFLVEEYLADAVPDDPDGFAAYLSVESIVQGGVIGHLAVTGRMPVAPPLRETGFVIPANIRGSETDELLAVAERAIDVLGVRDGCLHTEIKRTPDGPRVIEVNGRPGGGIPEMMALVSDVDVFKIAIDVALGRTVALDGLIPCRHVAYRFYYQPPTWARRVVSVAGLDRIASLPGVEHVALQRGPGHPVEPRQGTRSYVFSVIGSSEDHDGVRDVWRRIGELAEVHFSPDEVTAQA